MFQPGKSGNPSGRPKGAVNKTSAAIKERLESFLTDKLNKVEELYEELTPREQAQFLTDLMPYVLAKRKEVDHNINLEEERILTIKVVPVAPPTLPPAEEYTEFSPVEVLPPTPVQLTVERDFEEK